MLERAAAVWLHGGALSVVGKRFVALNYRRTGVRVNAEISGGEEIGLGAADLGGGLLVFGVGRR